MGLVALGAWWRFAAQHHPLFRPSWPFVSLTVPISDILYESLVLAMCAIVCLPRCTRASAVRVFDGEPRSDPASTPRRPEPP
jgi:hypothetical protein